jgi:hypothetical protein
MNPKKRTAAMHKLNAAQANSIMAFPLPVFPTKGYRDAVNPARPNSGQRG